MEKQTHIQRRREQAKSQQEQVINLLRFKRTETTCSYGLHVYRCGLSYLHYYVPGDPVGIAFLERSKIFWNWWKNKWADRDRDFLEMWLVNNNWKKVELRTLQTLYKELHDPLVLSQDEKPQAVVLGNSYARMYQDVIDHEILKDDK